MEIKLTDQDKEILKRHSAGVRARAMLELAIVDALWDAAAKAGYWFELCDDREAPTDTREAFKTALFDLDAVGLDVYEGRDCRGWVYLIFGNDGWDLISNYSTSLESFLTPVREVESLLGA